MSCTDKSTVIHRRLLSIALLSLAIQPVLAVEATRLPVERNTDNIRMLRGTDGPIAIRGNSQTPLADRVANQFAPQFGIRNPAAQLRVKKSRIDNAQTHIRYQQLHQGLPVIGGELIANVDNQNRLTSMSGEVSNVRSVDITPAVSAEQASQTAMAAVAKWYKLNKDQLVTSTPELSIFDPTLIVTAPGSSHMLAWQLNVSPNTIAPINEFVVVDAKTGGIVFHFNKVDTARNRRTYSALNQVTLPGSLLCNEATDPCNSGIPDAEAAHNFARDTYDYYFATHGRDSIDNSGMTIVSTVRFGDATFQNAFWLGADPFLGASNQMVYGNGFSLADDVVGHELTHGVTENTSNLFYYSESGAINEALSDLWGELIDLDNGAGTDTPAVRWKLGEDLPTAIGVIRDMANPPAFNDPDRIGSTFFYVGTDDNGGVHINSGVNNKAVYLMVDGGTFNSQTVTAIGAVKTAKIYYEAQTNLLTSGSDYLDLYNALRQACTNLLGTNGIVADDCTQVQTALTAVQMNQAPSVDYAPQATAICPVGENVYDLFADNFEANNLSKWSAANLTGSINLWSTGNLNLAANSGNYTLMSSGFDSGTLDSANSNDSTLAMSSTIRVPASATMYIHFDHAFYFETETVPVTTFYDGGLIEYSTDNGSTWNDAEGLIESGRDYTGILDDESPASSNRGFVGFSNGYTSTRLDLSPLEGEVVSFRFRNAADYTVSSAPWFIDNFRIYICGNNAPPVPNAGSDQSVNLVQSVQLAGTATDPDGDTLTIAWAQTSGDPVTLTGANTLTPSFTARPSTSALVFTLTVTDTAGNVETDSVIVTVGITLGGTGGNSGCSFSPNGRFDPLWILLLLSLAGMHLRNRRRQMVRK